ncbi:MAG: fibronectin type III domain-containing protein, partial [Acidobacteriota bacterium]|nr:fibronectin type III domain-containing protein [Acidobacteriota bacterium]
VIYETTFDFVASSATPKTPRVVAITATSGGFVLRVQSPTTNESGVTRFQYSLNGGASWVTFTSTTVNVRNLLKHHVYLVRVRALNAAGVSPASPTRRVVTKS